MLLDLTTLLALAPVCAPAVAPQTLLAVVQVESGLDPLAIGVNGARPEHLSFADPQAAARAAHLLIAEGRNVDLGLGQINVRNLAPLDLSVEEAFDPCRNLAASAAVLRAAYVRAAPQPGAEQAALRTALSYYNTGGPDRGFANGYVARVTAAALPSMPEIVRVPRSTRSATTAVSSRDPWDVFGRAPASPHQAFVFNPNSGAEP